MSKNAGDASSSAASAAKPGAQAAQSQILPAKEQTVFKTIVVRAPEDAYTCWRHPAGRKTSYLFRVESAARLKFLSAQHELCGSFYAMFSPHVEWNPPVSIPTLLQGPSEHFAKI